MSKLLDPQTREQLTGQFLKGADFEGEGLALAILSMKAEKADDPKYGVKEDGNGLKAGETWVYTFETENGTQKVFKNSSARLSGAISRLDPETGTKLRIKRSGESYDTEWSVELV